MNQRTAVIFLATLIGGCAVGPDYHRPEVTLPATYRNGNVVATPSSTPADWWRGFNDAELDRVLERTVAGNLDLAAAGARLDVARAVARRAGAARLPRLEASGSAAAVHESLVSPLGSVTRAVGAPRDYDDFAVGAQASWEPDLFGELRRGYEAARADAEALQMQRAAVRLAVTAEAADAYLALRGLEAERSLAQRRVDTESKLVELVGRRVHEGVSADRELQRTVAELERIRATIPPLEAAIDAQLNRLDVLMGAPAGSFRDEPAGTGTQPLAPRPAGGDAPVDLLRRRPDVLAAERRLRSANARIGVALAGYYPRLSFSAALGVESSDSSSLFANEALRTVGAGGLRWRLFDFGRVDAEVAVARGREAEALAVYRGAVLRATEDVATALSRYLNAGAEATALSREITALERARDQAADGYAAGVLPLIEVLDADRELLTAADRLASARAGEARAAVAAFRALGGDWNG